MKPTRCGDCPKWQPANPDAMAGWCPVRKATRLANAVACKEVQTKEAYHAEPKTRR